MVTGLWANRQLIYTLTKHEILGRYRGSLLGILWSLFNPVFMLLVYTFVFSVVFKARWAGGGDSKIEFAMVLFSGMLVYGLFSECVNRAPSLVLSNANYVKKVVFPLEILPLVSMGSALFHLMVGLLVWLLFYVVFFGMPHVTIITLPLVLLPLILLTMGLSWGLASLGVYLRDIGQVVSVITMAMMFLSPIFYPVSALPEQYQTYLHMNPLTPVIEQTRQVLFWGELKGVLIWCVYLFVSLILAWLGYAWFQKTRKGFSDVV